MTRVKKLAYAALIALALIGGASTPTLAAPPPECPFIPEDCEEGELTRKVNEYEGQHLASQADDNNSDAYKKGSFDITEVQLASGDDNNGDVPVVPGLAGDPSQWG